MQNGYVSVPKFYVIHTLPLFYLELTIKVIKLDK